MSPQASGKDLTRIRADVSEIRLTHRTPTCNVDISGGRGLALLSRRPSRAEVAYTTLKSISELDAMLPCGELRNWVGAPFASAHTVTAAITSQVRKSIRSTNHPIAAVLECTLKAPCSRAYFSANFFAA